MGTRVLFCSFTIRRSMNFFVSQGYSLFSQKPFPNAVHYHSIDGNTDRTELVVQNSGMI